MTMAGKEEPGDRPRGQDTTATARTATGSGAPEQALTMEPGESPAWATGAAPPTGLTGEPVERDPRQLDTDAEHEVIGELDKTESPHYQRAGQARQIARELENLEAYGAGDGQRARALRRDLEGLGLDPQTAVGNPDDPSPAGRETRQERMARTEGGSSGQPAPRQTTTPTGGTSSKAPGKQSGDRP